MQYTDGQIDNCSLHWRMNGRTYKVLAIRESAAAANDLLATRSELAVLQVIGQSVIMVNANDKGVPFSAAA